MNFAEFRRHSPGASSKPSAGPADDGANGRKIGLPILVFILSLITVVLLQNRSGSRSAELSGYPDEPAHYVTGLMVRGFVLHGWQEASPISFAKRFYLHYPKVAIGHWPPVYYLAQLVWMAIFPATISSLLYLEAVLLAAIATILFSMAESRLGLFSALVLCAVFLANHSTQELGAEIMSEPLLALLTLLATLAVARHFETGRLAPLIWFGVLAEMAAHTKGSGILLFAVPSLVAVFLRRYDEFRKPAFWLTHLAMLLILAPWNILTWKMVNNGMEGPVGLPLIARQSLGFGRVTVAALGWPLLAAILLGGFLSIARRRFRDPLMISLAVTAGLTVVFHCIAPNGVEPRRLFMAFPGALVLAAVPVVSLLGGPRRRRWAPVALFALALPSPAAPFHKVTVGYRDASRWLLGDPERQEGATLVSSEIDGEGMLISEIGQIQPDPALYIVRSSKLFTDCGWLGGDCRLKVDEPRQAEEVLDSIPIRCVVVDSFAGVSSKQDTALVRRTVAARPDLWVLRKTIAATDPVKGRRGEILIYERLGLTRPGQVRVQIDLRRMIGEVISDQP